MVWRGSLRDRGPVPCVGDHGPGRPVAGADGHENPAPGPAPGHRGGGGRVGEKLAPELAPDAGKRGGIGQDRNPGGVLKSPGFCDKRD